MIVVLLVGIVLSIYKFAYVGFALFETPNEVVAARRGEKKPERRPDVLKKRE